MSKTTKKTKKTKKSKFNKDESIALSSDQVQRIFNQYTGKVVKITQTNNIRNATDINQIVGENNPYTILFSPVNSAYSGHYQALFYTNDSYYFFDSYGHNYTALYNKVNNAYGKGAFNNSDIIGKLLLKSGKPIYMNVYAYQSNSALDDTCGRHSVCCLIYFIKNIEQGIKYDFNTYYTDLTLYKTNHKLETYDDVVIKITNRYMNHIY